jgi:hypothetical protein
MSLSSIQKFPTVSGNRSLTVAALIGAATVRERFPARCAAYATHFASSDTEPGLREAAVAVSAIRPSVLARTMATHRP